MTPSERIDRLIVDLADWRGRTFAVIREAILSADGKIVEECKWMGSPVCARTGRASPTPAGKHAEPQRPATPLGGTRSKRIARDPLKDSLNYYIRRTILRWHGLHDIPEDMMFGRDAAGMLLVNELLMKKSNPKFCPGQVALSCAHGTNDLDNIWQNRVSELQTYRSGGNHITLIEQPYVRLAKTSEFG